MKSEKAKQCWCEFRILSDEDKDNIFVGNYDLQNSFLFGLIK